MAEAKVRLSLSVPGAQMLSSQECDKNPKDSYNTEVISVEFRSKKGKVCKENITVRTRKNRLVKQSLSISKEAYNYMIDPSEPPTAKLAKEITVVRTFKKGKTVTKVPVKTTVWKNFSVNQRLNYHMARTAESLGAVDYSFEVFND